MQVRIKPDGMPAESTMNFLEQQGIFQQYDISKGTTQILIINDKLRKMAFKLLAWKYRRGDLLLTIQIKKDLY